jgi:hypothetical protein
MKSWLESTPEVPVYTFSPIFHAQRGPRANQSATEAALETRFERIEALTWRP